MEAVEEVNPKKVVSKYSGLVGLNPNYQDRDEHVMLPDEVRAFFKAMATSPNRPLKRPMPIQGQLLIPWALRRYFQAQYSKMVLFC